MNLSTTTILIIVNVIVSIFALNNKQAYNKMMMNPYAVKNNNEYFRFITSGFIHADFRHLGFNMFTLFFFGDVVERQFNYSSNGNGMLLFILFYVAAIVISEIPTFLKHQNNPRYNSLGASGGVSAVVFASIMYTPLKDLCLYGLICIPGFILAILYLVYSATMGKKGSGNINHDAHLYGAIFGVLFTIILDPDVFSRFIEQVSNYSLFQ